MRVLFSFLLFGAAISYATAQDYIPVDHLSGTSDAGGNEVTVQAYGKGPGNMRFGDTGPYHIGNANRINGYDFSFGRAVKTVKIHITAIDAGERIEIGVNGKKYALARQNLTTGDGKTNTIVQTEDGAIAFDDKKSVASVVVTISPGYGINSVYVHHLNGTAAGVVFDLSFSENNTGNGATGIGGMNNNHWSLNLYPNPNTGNFVLTGTGNIGPEFDLEIINPAGQKVYSRHATKKAGGINEAINLDGSLANGVYTLSIIDGEKKQTTRFTLDR
jgi:hypothetical protein